ncbi:MAG TPA: ribosome maturation factor RimP [Micromonosporaceae bacterium]|jgi:ribosome maturation factor RimP
MPPAQRRTGARPSNRRPEPEVTVNRARVVEVVEPVAAAAGYDLEDLAVVRMGRRFVVRVSVDRDGGVPLDAVADLARAVSTALDEAESAGGDLIPGEYQLEVSSPGVSRPLTLPRHWRRNTGRLVKVRVGGHTIVGRVLSADDERVELDVEGDVRELAYADLGPGRVEIEFSRVDEVAEEDMVAFDGDDDDDKQDEDEEDAQ